MPDDIQDILFVFLVENLSAVVRSQPVLLPTGLANYIRTEVIDSGGAIPFPSDLADLIFVYGLSRQDRF